MNFTWHVGAYQEVLPYLAGIKLRDFYLNPKACAKSYREGRKRLVEIFGKDIQVPALSVPHLSYGHLSCLGVEVIFPQDSAPSVRPILPSIEKGIKLLKRKIDFSECKLFKHFLRLFNYLKREFPGEKVSIYGFGWEGPITSAVLLRGTGFLVDIYRKPKLVKEFLDLLTENIIQYVYFLRRIMGDPEVNPHGTGLCDDCSSYIPPRLWEEFVIPYWDKYFSVLTKGKRHLHAEGLYPQHLKYLEKAKIDYYDPSVSPKLSPRILASRLKIPFAWRLPAFYIPYMSEEEVEEWVFNAYRDGARNVYTIVENIICTGSNPAKIRAFIKACKKIEARKY